MFDGWFSLRVRCGECGFSFERDEEEDYWLGAFLLNFVVTEVIFAALMLGVLVATWPNPPWSSLFWIGAVQMIVAPIVFYPFSKALWRTRRREARSRATRSPDPPAARPSVGSSIQAPSRS
jgi:uncharacterized protein (DUF983 family)